MIICCLNPQYVNDFMVVSFAERQILREWLLTTKTDKIRFLSPEFFR